MIEAIALRLAWCALGAFVGALAMSLCKCAKQADNEALRQRFGEVLAENHDLILKLAKADTNRAQLEADLADAYDIIAIQHLMTGTPAGREKRGIVH